MDSSFTPSSPFSFKITPHFKYGEFTQNDEARRFKHQHQCDTAVKLANFLELMRNDFGKPVIITSGHRPKAINESVGGAPNSEHLYDIVGKGAVDVKISGVDPLVVENWIDERWQESVGQGQAKNRGFTHIGCRGDGLRRRWDY